MSAIATDLAPSIGTFVREKLRASSRLALAVLLLVLASVGDAPVCADISITSAAAAVAKRNFSRAGILQHSHQAASENQSEPRIFSSSTFFERSAACAGTSPPDVRSLPKLATEGTQSTTASGLRTGLADHVLCGGTKELVTASIAYEIERGRRAAAPGISFARLGCVSEQ